MKKYIGRFSSAYAYQAITQKCDKAAIEIFYVKCDEINVLKNLNPYSYENE